MTEGTVRYFHRILPDERQWLVCDPPHTLYQEFFYLVCGVTPPVTFIRCLWKAVCRRLA